MADQKEKNSDNHGCLRKTVVLVGMMGAGKTAIGKALADALNVPFLDSDEEIVRAANMSIAEIFERDGEAFFRDREAEVISRLMKEEIGVLSTGGGAFLQDHNRAVISLEGCSVWLDVPLPVLWERVRHKDTRPLLRTSDPLKTLTELYNSRSPTYAKADLAVQAPPECSIEQMRDAVLKTLATRDDVLAMTKG